MRKGIVILALLCILLGVGIFLMRKNEDRVGPEIVFPEGEVELIEGDDEILLEGVKAIDDIDEDVSSTLLISGIYPNTEETEAKVVYLAKDKSNNVTTATRSVKYKATGVKEQAVNDVETPEEELEQDLLPMTDDEETEVTPTPEVTATPEPEVTEEPEVNPEAPKVVLTKARDTVTRGTTINRLLYVQDITDDEDEREYLFRQIQINGDVDTTTTGEYEVTYHVVDSDGNRSEDVKLVVIVE